MRKKVNQEANVLGCLGKAGGTLKQNGGNPQYSGAASFFLMLKLQLNWNRDGSG
ncbi:hypothetical protein GCM10028819_09810 [Spirosoma humi]